MLANWSSTEEGDDNAVIVHDLFVPSLTIKKGSIDGKPVMLVPLFDGDSLRDAAMDLLEDRVTLDTVVSNIGAVAERYCMEQGTERAEGIYGRP
jgi:hypothetical protein